MVGFFIGCPDDLLRFRREPCQTLAPAWPGGYKDQRSNETWRLSSDLLGDEATHGETQHVHFRKTECSNERDGVGAHAVDGSWYLARATGHARVVEKNDFAILGEFVGHRRIPMI